VWPCGCMPFVRPTHANCQAMDMDGSSSSSSRPHAHGWLCLNSAVRCGQHAAATLDASLTWQWRLAPAAVLLLLPSRERRRRRRCRRRPRTTAEESFHSHQRSDRWEELLSWAGPAQPTLLREWMDDEAVAISNRTGRGRRDERKISRPSCCCLQPAGALPCPSRLQPCESGSVVAAWPGSGRSS
jgi:hypothetical protein